MPTFFQRLQHSWNAFRGRDRPENAYYGPASYRRPDQIHLRVGNERSIITAIYNRIAMDVAALSFEHVKVDENGRYVETVHDGLNNCLTLEANIDQTSRAFIQDGVLSMFDEGTIAIVPIDTDIDPEKSASYEIGTMRIGKITQWMPREVRVLLYNDRKGMKEELTFPKSLVGIIQNPFYVVMNEANSTLQRLIRKLVILDAIDEQSGAGKLDLIIQLPYTVKSPLRREQAENRRKDIEMQLAGSKYGIAYAEATEKITQLNRPIENNLMSQIEYLMNTLYSQLGITPEILNGTADEKTMLNYMTRTVEPIASAFVDEIKRKFLTKTARTQGHSIMFFSDPFKLVPISNIADIADRFTRNEILTPNEIRSIVGFKPDTDPQSDQLRNRNIIPNGEAMLPENAAGYTEDQQSQMLLPENQNGIEEQPVENNSVVGLDNVANMPIVEFNRMLNMSNTG